MDKTNQSGNIVNMQPVYYHLPMMPDLSSSPFSLVDGGGFFIQHLPQNKLTPTKRGRGRPKMYHARSRDGTPMAGMMSPAGTMSECRKKRKYNRREKRGSVKIISDITDLTEHIADILDSSTASNDETPIDFGEVNFQHLENSTWCPEEIKLENTDQYDTDQDKEDIANYNNLIQELLSESCKRGQRGSDGGDSENSAKRTTRPTSRPNVLNCRRKALNGLTYNEGTPMEVVPTSPTDDRCNTWNYRIGGKCTNKWQLFEKHVLENKVVKQLREKRLTDRLIKVLSSTPQRKLRRRKSSTPTKNDAENNTNEPTRISTDNDENGQTDDILVEKSTYTEGYCPDIEPTLLIWPSSFARSLHNTQICHFAERANVEERWNVKVEALDISADSTNEAGLK